MGFTFTNVNTAHAQLEYYGIKGGTSFANVNGSDVNGDPSTRTGILVGAYAGLSFGDVPVTIQPEINYIQKGFKSDNSGVTVTTKLNYIEVPILAKYSIDATESVKPHVIAGPYLGINITSKQAAGGQSQNLQNISTTDFGIAAGAGVNVSGIDITARYDLGLSQLPDSGNSDFKNGAIMLTAGYSF